MNCLTAFLKKTGHLEEVIRDLRQMEDPPDAAFLTPGFHIGGPSALVTKLEKGLDVFELDRQRKELEEEKRKHELEKKLLRDQKAEIEQLYRDLRDVTKDPYYRLCEEQRLRLKEIHDEIWARAVAGASWREPMPAEPDKCNTVQATDEEGGGDVLELEADYGEVEKLVSEVN